MKRIGLMIGFVALLVAVLPPLPAQDVKKDDVKKDEAKKDEAKKDEPKKEEAKKDEKKDPEPKDDEKKKTEPKKAEKEKVNSGQVLQGVKIISASAENGREFTIEVQELDPKKVYDTTVWATQRQGQLMQELFNAQKQKGQGYLQAMFNYNKNVANFQVEMMKRQAGNYSPKNVDVKAAENAKVRTLFLPAEFDDAGAVKKWTKKEIEARKDKTGLPGFPADFDAIKSGQYIDLYMAKPAPAAKTPAKKKGPDDDDVPVAKARPEYVMIVIRAEATQK